MTTPSIPDRLAETVDDLATKLGAAMIFGPNLLVVAEWICTGDPVRPTLAHMLRDAYGDLPPDIDAACEAALFISGAMMKAPVLECWRCGARKIECGCCQTHRLDDYYSERCTDCNIARLNYEADA